MARIKTGKSSAPHFVDAHIGSHIHMRRKFLNMSQDPGEGNWSNIPANSKI